MLQECLRVRKLEIKAHLFLQQRPTVTPTVVLERVQEQCLISSSVIG
nr:hypothetical protein [Tanacetum cinerariifolium]